MIYFRVEVYELWLMTMYWSYLTNETNKLLTFESHADLNKMSSDYNELIAFGFFKQFQGYTQIFVSNKSPLENPETSKLFELNLFF